jgi:hypothetical protein
MSHDGHALPEKPNTSSTAAFTAVLIFVGFIVALINFTQVMGHDDAANGHGTEHAAPSHGNSHGADAHHSTPAGDSHTTSGHDAEHGEQESAAHH